MKFDNDFKLKMMMLGLFIGFLAFVPLIIIWCLNTLFPALAIPTTYETYFAIVILSLLFYRSKVECYPKKWK